eukprot:SAG31_NODE_1028_length_10273_cov_22.700413_5_plen_296_part_00
MTLGQILDPVVLRRTWVFEFPVFAVLYAIVSSLWLLTCQNFDRQTGTLWAGKVSCQTGYWVWISWTVGLAVTYIGRCCHLAQQSRKMGLRLAAIMVSVLAVDRLMLEYFRHIFTPALQDQGLSLIVATSVGPWLAGEFFNSVLSHAWPESLSEDRQRPLGLALFVIITFWERNMVQNIASCGCRRLNSLVDKPHSYCHVPLQIYHIAVAESLAGDVDAQEAVESSVALAYAAVLFAAARSVLLTCLYIPLETLKTKKCTKSKGDAPMTTSEAREAVIATFSAFERDHEAQCWGCK